MEIKMHKESKTKPARRRGRTLETIGATTRANGIQGGNEQRESMKPGGIEGLRLEPKRSRTKNGRYGGPWGMEAHEGPTRPERQLNPQ